MTTKFNSNLRPCMRILSTQIYMYMKYMALTFPARLPVNPPITGEHPRPPDTLRKSV